MDAPKKDAEKASRPALSDYTVARGRTVYVDNKPVGPGGSVAMIAVDAEHLVHAGFLRAASDDVRPVSQGVQVGGLQIKGGRRPGGTVV
jgi:hypothetical protein